jgi:lipopolysaccharide/colanic/teichoic acid biosynthesis glycosyltransferase
MFRYGHNEEDAVEKLMFDLYYIKNWSFWLELEIGLRTVMIMLRKKGT